MLLYLTSNENIGIFDFLSIEKGILIKKLSGSFKLMQFILRDMRSLDHYSYFAIDLSAVGDTEGEIIEAIGAFKKMFASRIVFYIDDIGVCQERCHIFFIFFAPLHILVALINLLAPISPFNVCKSILVLDFEIVP